MVQRVLSRREREVLGLVAEGCTSREIARRLRISEATVKDYVGRAMHKLQAPNRSAAIAAWMRTRPDGSIRSAPSEERA